MKVEILLPTPIYRQRFSLATSKHIPKSPGCYVLTTHNGEILYIGLSKNLNNRIKQQLDDLKKIKITEFGRVFWFYYLTITSEFEINRQERGWLNQHELIEGKLPLLNSLRSPVR